MKQQMSDNENERKHNRKQWQENAKTTKCKSQLVKLTQE